MQVKRLAFPAKLNLCIAMGLVPKEWRAAILRVNAMRNEMAHQLDHAFSETDKMSLVRTMPKYAQELCLEESPPDKPEQVHWSRVIRSIPVLLDVLRQQHKRHRLEMKYAAINARIVLEETQPE
jgi:hypothetical protein